mmetsp:Transcript_42887/g.101818  ORF Transcript_42887/g.101818 Transcript_42887/m.101818 type:complete len:254 (-) Transcript_42887:2213-2974(-)
MSWIWSTRPLMARGSYPVRRTSLQPPWRLLTSVELYAQGGSVRCCSNGRSSSAAARNGGTSRLSMLFGKRCGPFFLAPAHVSDRPLWPTRPRGRGAMQLMPASTGPRPSKQALGGPWCSVVCWRPCSPLRPEQGPTTRCGARPRSCSPSTRAVCQRADRNGSSTRSRSLPSTWLAESSKGQDPRRCSGSPVWCHHRRGCGLSMPSQIATASQRDPSFSIPLRRRLPQPIRRCDGFLESDAKFTLRLEIHVHCI